MGVGERSPPSDQLSSVNDQSRGSGSPAVLPPRVGCQRRKSRGQQGECARLGNGGQGVAAETCDGETGVRAVVGQVVRGNPPPAALPPQCHRSKSPDEWPAPTLNER